MKQPTKKQLDKEFHRLKNFNRPGPNQANSFKNIAATEGLGSDALKYMLKGKVEKWTKRHFNMWVLCKNYSIENHVVIK